MDYISDYQYIIVITKIYLYPIIMIYPEKKKKGYITCLSDSLDIIG